MRFIEFENWHMRFVVDMYREDFIAALQDPPDLESHLLYTLFDGGQIIAIGGVLNHPDPFKGLGEMFFYKSPLYENKIIAYSRITSKFIDIVIEKGNFHRIQAAIPMSDHCGQRFIEFLQFNIESVLSNYGPDKEDFVRYIRLAGAN